VVDPLGGSWFVEEMTRRMVDGAFDYIRRIDDYGGMVEAIEAGFPQRELMDAAFAYQRAFEEKEKVIVGVNAFQLENEPPIDILYIPDDLAEKQIAFIDDVKSMVENQLIFPTEDYLKSTHSFMALDEAKMRQYEGDYADVTSG